MRVRKTSNISSISNTNDNEYIEEKEPEEYKWMLIAAFIFLSLGILDIVHFILRETTGSRLDEDEYKFWYYTLIGPAKCSLATLCYFLRNSQRPLFKVILFVILQFGILVAVIYLVIQIYKLSHKTSESIDFWEVIDEMGVEIIIALICIAILIVYLIYWKKSVKKASFRIKLERTNPLAHSLQEGDQGISTFSNNADSKNIPANDDLESNQSDIVEFGENDENENQMESSQNNENHEDDVTEERNVEVKNSYFLKWVKASGFLLMILGAIDLWNFFLNEVLSSAEDLSVAEQKAKDRDTWIYLSIGLLKFAAGIAVLILAKYKRGKLAFTLAFIIISIELASLIYSLINVIQSPRETTEFIVIEESLTAILVITIITIKIMKRNKAKSNRPTTTTQISEEVEELDKTKSNNQEDIGLTDTYHKLE